MSDLRVIVRQAANHLRSQADGIRQMRFNPNEANVRGDTRTNEEKEREHNENRDAALGALVRAEQLLSEYIERR